MKILKMLLVVLSGEKKTMQFVLYVCLHAEEESGLLVSFFNI